MLIALPLNDKTEYPIIAKEVKEWSALYPAVDVMQELREMRGWLLANPEKRKTRRGILRFVIGWLSREQDKPHATAGNAAGQSNGKPKTIDLQAIEQEIDRGGN